MRGNSIIIRKGVCRDSGYFIEEHRHSDRLGFLPPTFWVCRPYPDCGVNIGTGRSKDEAVTAMLARNPDLERLAA